MFILPAASIIITTSSYLMKFLGEESIILTSHEYFIYKQSELSHISSYIYNILLI